MDDSRSDAIKAANARRASHFCRKCANPTATELKDGSQVGGLPGIQYRCCNSCGHAQPITKRPGRAKLG